MKPIYKALIFVLAVAALLIIAYNSKSHHEFTENSYYVAPGDTLWDIATIYCPDDMDKREYIAEIEKLNGMKNSGIYAGQKIVVLLAKGE